MDDRTRKTLSRDNNIVEGKPSNSEIDYDMFLMSIANHSLLRYQQGREFEKDLEAALDAQKVNNSLAHMVDNLEESWESQHHSQLLQSRQANDRLPCHLRPTLPPTQYERFARPEFSSALTPSEKVYRDPPSMIKVPDYASPNISQLRREKVRFPDSSMVPTYGIAPHDTSQQISPVSGASHHNRSRTELAAMAQLRINTCPLETKAALTNGDLQTQSRSKDTNKVVLLKRQKGIGIEVEESQEHSQLCAEISENVELESPMRNHCESRVPGLGIEIPLSTSYKSKDFMRSGCTSLRGLSQASIHIGGHLQQLTPSTPLQTIKYNEENIEEEDRQTTLFDKIMELKVSSVRRITSPRAMD